MSDAVADSRFSPLLGCRGALIVPVWQHEDDDLCGIRRLNALDGH